MQNLWFVSRKGFNMNRRLFATIKDLGINIKPTDTLVPF